MNGQIGYLQILLFLLINPIKTIKGIHILNYDRQSLNKVYYITSTILANVFIYVKYGEQSFGLIFIGTVIFPFTAFINQYLITSVLLCIV